MIDIIIPTLNRANKIEPLLQNLLDVTKVPFLVTFAMETGDELSMQTRRRSHIWSNWEVGNFNSYTIAFNTAFWKTNHKYVFMGSDDIEFMPGWDKAAQVMEDDEKVHVVGMNSSGALDDRHHLQFLMRRSYINQHSLVEGLPNHVFYPYHHNFCDTELYYTALNRGVFKACPEAVVLHHRPADDIDETYKKSSRTAELDRATYNSRKHLFRGV